MQDMKPADIVGDWREHRLPLHGHGIRRVLVSGIETPFPNGRLIVSRTDLRGVITQVNRSFVEMSGYSEQELVGSQHSIVRHPDMPAEIFRALWETIQSGRTWQGYLKNLRKDGGYYWVKATVIPNVRAGRVVGYTSVRRKPSREMVDQTQALYCSRL